MAAWSSTPARRLNGWLAFLSNKPNASRWNRDFILSISARRLYCLPRRSQKLSVERIEELALRRVQTHADLDI